MREYKIMLFPNGRVDMCVARHFFFFSMAGNACTRVSQYLSSLVLFPGDGRT